MKKYIFTICSLLIFFGCDDDLLDQSNPNTLTPDVFWRSEADAQSAIIGAYSPLSTIFYHGRLFSGYALVQSDAVHAVGDFSFQTSLFNTNPADGNFTNGWAEMWKVIFRTNLILENVPAIDMDQTLKDNILGEAYFLRAYNYFMLVNYWQNVPLVVQPAATLAETQQPQATPAEVWTQIKQDLTDAITLLPTSWDAANKGRVTKGSAAALLGKSHLYLEEWADAARELKRIIDGEFGTYDLMPDYKDNFRANTENNIESLFEIQFDATGAWTAGWGSDVPATARYNSYARDLAVGSASYVNQWVLDLFLAEPTNGAQIDPRAYETLVWDYAGAEHFAGESFATKFASDIALANSDPTARRQIRSAKYVDPNGGGAVPAFNTSANNKRIIRFADVLLMYAEAENEDSGPTADAYAAINRVRDRVDMPPIPAALSKDNFRQRVRDERVLELTLESHRELDIKRWGLLPDRIVNNPEFRDANIVYVPGREYFPIPQAELDTNPFMKPNEGYN